MVKYVDESGKIARNPDRGYENYPTVLKTP